MLFLIIGVIMGAIVAFIAPPLVPTRYQSWWINTGLRILGIVIILFVIASTSFVTVPDGHVGKLFRVYAGGSLPAGRIVAVGGENGPQARILTPGFHFEPIINILNDVNTDDTEATVD